MIDDPDATLLGSAPGLAEAHFEHDGLITKRAVRAVALAMLRPRPGETLWDLGAGAGSVAIEWCRNAPTNRAFGVERREDRAAAARRNAQRLTMPGQLEIVVGDVDGSLGSLPRPDAVFIGGGADRPVVERCMETLHPGGRLVVHSVTIETEQLLAGLHEEFGGELMRMGLETSDRIGRLRGWAPSRTVIGWTWVKGEPSAD